MQRSVQAGRQGLTEQKYDELLNFADSDKFTEREKVALTYTSAIAWNSDIADDALWVTNGGPPVLLRNDGGNRNAWIGFELVGTASTRDAIGAQVTVTAGGRRRVRELVGGSSYCAAHDLRLLFGLGTVEKVEKVEIRWPSGVTSQLENLAARRYYRVQEPEKEKPAARDIKKVAKKPN